MRRLLSIFLISPLYVFAICDYPHNPPAYCLEFETLGAPTKIKNYAPFECEYRLKKFIYYRPGNTFHYNDNLDKIVLRKKNKVDLSNSQRIKVIDKIYSKSCDIDKSGKLLVHLNCYDSNENIPDFHILTDGKARGNVFETRSQKNIEYICN